MLTRVRDALHDPAARNRGLFRADYVDALLDDPNRERHPAGKQALATGPARDVAAEPWDLRPGWTTWRGRATAAPNGDPAQSLPVAREVIGPGGDPRIAHPEAEPAQPSPGVALDCGWGQIVFGQTFGDRSQAAEVLRAEAEGTRDICIYLRDAHVFVAEHPDEFFVDPSLTYRLDLPAGQISARAARERDDQPFADHRGGRRGQRDLCAQRHGHRPSEVLLRVASQPEVLPGGLLSTGRVVGTVTVVDHVALFDDPAKRVLAVVPDGGSRRRPIGLGQALLGRLSAEMTARAVTSSICRCSPTTPARSVFTSGWFSSGT